MQQDSELVSAYLAGDTRAFTELYERYVERIYNFVYFKVHQRELAEDLTSQTFMKAFERMNQFRDDRGTFSAWIHTIARNGITDHFRSLHTSKPLEDAWDLASDDDTAKHATDDIAVEQIRSVLQTLSADQRDVLLLRLWNGYSFAEVADALGKTEAACKMAYKRGIERVRKELLLSFLLLFFFS